MKYGFVIDNRKCIGCHACTVACKSEHQVPVGVNRTWVKYIEKGQYPNTSRAFSVMRCNHCEDAPCIEICPVSALYQREDGIVDFDNQKCIGCKSCMQACPYDALYIDPQTHTAAKCNYCAHRVDVGLEPACVNICPEEAIVSGDLDNPDSKISKLVSREQVQVRKMEKGTKPKLFYIGGDTASLTPTAATSNVHMQSNQATGVGHFAKFAEQRANTKDKSELAQKLLMQSEQILAKKLPQIFATTGEENKQPTHKVYDAPTKGILWGWEVSAYVWTKAIACGAFIIPFFALLMNIAPVTIQILWLSVAITFLFLMITALLLVKDLDKPTRFLYVMLRPQWKSWLVRGGYAIAIFKMLVIIWAIAHFSGLLLLQKIVSYAGLLMAVVVAVYTAFLFAQAKGRDFWQSPILPLHMLVHAIMAGAGVFIILDYFIVTDPKWYQYLTIVLISSLLCNLLILASELWISHPTKDAQLTVKAIVYGRYKKLFWIVTIVFGNILPLCLLFSGSILAATLAGIAILIGIYSTEHIWVYAPQLIPLA